MGNQYFLVLFQSFLVSWTKGFKSSGVEGKDVVTLIRKAIQRRGVSRGSRARSQGLGSGGPLHSFESTLKSCLVCPQTGMSIFCGS